MDSPETTKASASASAASPPIKDSPFSSYVSTLSPIQYPSVSRAFGDLTFPSPEPVFTSPHITLARKSDSVKSSLSLTSVGRAKFSLQHSSDATTFPANVPRSGEHTSTSVVHLIHTEIDSEGNPSCDHESCVISSSSLDASIADPSHICGNPSASSESLNQVAEMHKNVHRICTITDESRMKSCRSDFARLRSVSPSGSALVDEFVTDPEMLSDSSDLQSKQDEALSEAVHSDCLTSQEMNARVHVSLASASAENDFAADEACFLGNPSLNDGLSNTVDEAKEANKALLDEQFVPTINSNYVAGHSFLEPAAGQQPEVNVADQNRINYVSSGLDSKGNGDALFHEKPSVVSYYDSNARDLKSQVSSTHEKEILHPAQSLPQPFQDVQAVDNDTLLLLENNVLFSENHIPNDEEITQNQRGMRKRLQFEVAENQKAITECQGQSTSFSSIVFCKESLEISADMHASNPSHLEPIEISRMKIRPQLVSESDQCKLIVKSDASGQKRGSSFATDHRPSGIGLHLNSIGSIGYANSTTVVQLLGKDSCVDDGSFPDGNDQLLQSSNCELVSTGLTREGSDKLTENAGKPIVDFDREDNGDKILKHKTMELSTSSDSHQTPQCAKASQCSMHSKHTNLYMTPCNLKRPLSTDNSKLIDSNQTSPRKKRKKASDSEGQKRCSCKRSKCLKLYCDCFAAGTFCTEDCGCQQCVNRPENADTIRETKQQIESRNPLAFAPKVVLSVRDPPKDCDESVGTTPTSARHKRGCNCKKSLCLKKYCECYQAGVGCSFGCRCEDCKNIFGRRDGCTEIIEIEHKKSEEHENIREIVDKSDRKSGLSPLTPSIQFSSGVDAAKALVPISYYTSPETSASAIPYYEGSPGSPLNSISKGTYEKESDNMTRVSYPELDFDINVDTFSPGWDGFPDICNFSPMAKISPSNGDASTSSKAKEPKILQTRLFQGNPLALGPRWRCSPVTPLRQFGGSKIVLEPDSENELNKTVDDDTPDILKETSSPTRAVSSTSPKQKRVSPPKRLLRESRSSSSSGRSGRKFILQAVPSFPPLTPYSNNNDRGSGT